MDKATNILFLMLTTTGLGWFLSGCSQSIKAPRAASQVIMIGIPSCDGYLGNYLACHRAAGIYSSEALATHYQIMRDTLQREATDPNIRPYLAKRCMGLMRQLLDAVQGPACTMRKAPSR